MYSSGHICLSIPSSVYRRPSIICAALLWFVFVCSLVAQAAEITLTWRDPHNDPAAIGGYMLYYWEPGGDEMSVDVGQRRTYTVQDLQAGQTYHFVVTAYGATEEYESATSNELTVTLPVVSNQAPVAFDSTETTTQDMAITGELRAEDADADALTYQLVSPARMGRVTLSALTGAYQYQPFATVVGIDSFTFMVSDDATVSNVATVTITIRPANDHTPVMEIGDVQVDHVWHHVTFKRAFTDPVVVAKPLSHYGNDPAVIRIRQVTTTGFDIRVQEWGGLNAAYVPEIVSYLAMEHGRHPLGGGLAVEAGVMTARKALASTTTGFRQPFTSVPVVMASVITFNDAEAVTTQLHNVKTTSFQMRLLEQDNNTPKDLEETVAYIAWEPSSGILGNGLSFEVDTIPGAIGYAFSTLEFMQIFTSAPMFLADIQTMSGSSPVNLRWENKHFSRIDLQLSGPKSPNNTPTSSAPDVGYMAFAANVFNVDSDGDGVLNIDELTFYGTDPDVADTDHDGIPDGKEIALWGKKWRSDPDADGLNNLLDFDADDNGVLDNVETIKGANPAVLSSRP